MSNNNIWDDRIGEEFGELTFIEHLGRGKVLFKCSCGKETTKFYYDVRNGKTTSCGHVLIEKELTGLEGLKFGKLTAIKYLGKRNKQTHYLFKCECGNEVERMMKEVRRGKLMSCGCNLGNRVNHHKTHGLSDTRIYDIWKNMKRRCEDKNDKAYVYYGERGIYVYEGWNLGDEGLFNFINWSINNGYDDHLTIDRINVDGNYEPSNCRWISMKSQQNNKTTNLYFTYKEETLTLAEWCEKLNLKYTTVHKRLHKYKFDFEKAVTYKYHNIVKK